MHQQGGELPTLLCCGAGQHNLQQRIQHHQRVKEDNARLKHELTSLQDQYCIQSARHALCLLLWCSGGSKASPLSHSEQLVSAGADGGSPMFSAATVLP